MKGNREMAEPLISVIVPVFNTSAVLKNTVDSILNQTYRNIEIILVDDGSTDGCADICDELGRQHRSIRVFHKENGGQSSARNLGIRVSKGDLIGFVDSDDYIASGMYEYLYRLMCEYDADITSIHIQSTYSTDCEVEQPNETITVKQGIDILRYYMEITTKSDGYSVCRCLFKRYTVLGYKFREGFRYEDIDFKFAALSKAKTFVDSNQTYYYYLQTENTTSFAPLKKRDGELAIASDVLHELASQTCDKEIIHYADIKKARTPLSLLIRAAYVGFDEKEYSTYEQKQVVRQLINELRRGKSCLLSSPIPRSRKMATILLCVNYYLLKIPLGVYRKIWKCCRRG